MIKDSRLKLPHRNKNFEISDGKAIVGKVPSPMRFEPLL